MFTSGSSRRRRIASTTVVLLQAAILCMSLLGPAFVSAAEPKPAYWRIVHGRDR